MALLLLGLDLKGIVMLFRVVGTFVLIISFAAILRLLFSDMSDIDYMYMETGRFLTVTIVFILLLCIMECVIYFVTGQVI